MNKDKINEYIEDLLTVACCPGHDYSCKEVYKYIKKLQSNWNSLKEDLYQANRELVPNELVNGKELINNILDKMNELEIYDYYRE